MGTYIVEYPRGMVVMIIVPEAPWCNSNILLFLLSDNHLNNKLVAWKMTFLYVAVCFGGWLTVRLTIRTFDSTFNSIRNWNTPFFRFVFIILFAFKQFLQGVVDNPTNFFSSKPARVGWARISKGAIYLLFIFCWSHNISGHHNLDSLWSPS